MTKDEITKIEKRKNDIRMSSVVNRKYSTLKLGGRQS